MKLPITLRLDAALLAMARSEARRDSRSLTNFIEVALRSHLASAENATSVRTEGTQLQDTAGRRGREIID
jgi:hypothetical protein